MAFATDEATFITESAGGVIEIDITNGEIK